TRKLVRVLWMSPFARANLVAAVRELEAGGQVDPFAAFGDERRGQVDSTPGRWEPARIRIRVDAYGSRIDAVAALERRHRLAALCPVTGANLSDAVRVSRVQGLALSGI